MNRPATENLLIAAIARAILAIPQEAKITTTATGEYGDGSRIIAADVGPYDVGPMIGTNGGMKLAIQTLLAFPHGGDACQLRLSTTRTIKPPYCVKSEPDPREIASVLAALGAHLAPATFTYRVETSPTAVIAMLATRPDVCDATRSPLTKIIRAIGRCRGYPAMIAIERTGTMAASYTTTQPR